MIVKNRWIGLVMLCLCLFATPGFSTMGAAPIYEYRNYIGSYDFLDDADTVHWEIGDKEYVGLTWGDRSFPIFEIGVDRSIGSFDMSKVPFEKRIFHHLRTEAIDENRVVLWFVFDLADPPISAFVKMHGNRAPKPGKELDVRTMQMLRLYLLCTPSLLTLECASF